MGEYFHQAQKPCFMHESSSFDQQTWGMVISGALKLQEWMDFAGVDNNRGNCRGRLCRSGQTCLDAPLEVAMDMLMCVLNCIGYNW